LSNWYVRRCRDRFWASEKNNDKWDAYHTLYECLTTIGQVIAPFVPFFADELHRNLVVSTDPNAAESVHLTDWPSVNEALIDVDLSEEMQAVRDIVSLGQSTRAMHKLKVRQPLAAAEVILGKPALAARVRPYLPLILEELNVKEVRFIDDPGDRVSFEVKPNYRALGPRFGKRMPEIRAALDGADANAIRTALTTDHTVSVTLANGEAISLSTDEVEVAVSAQEGYAASGGSVGTVILDSRLTDALVAEGLAREVQSRIQGLRKDQDMEYQARIAVYLTGDASVLSACTEHKKTIASETLATTFVTDQAIPENAATLDVTLGDAAITIGIHEA
jgi:isoleucyl-tRNA synthetase